jgi:hypothetical protein
MRHFRWRVRRERPRLPVFFEIRFALIAFAEAPCVSKIAGCLSEPVGIEGKGSFPSTTLIRHNSVIVRWSPVLKDHHHHHHYYNHDDRHYHHSQTNNKVWEFERVWNPGNCAIWILQNDGRGGYTLVTREIRAGADTNAPYLPMDDPMRRPLRPHDELADARGDEM